MSNDIPGAKKTIVGLTQIKGIGGMFAKAMINLLKISPNSSIGYLTDEQVKSIEKIIKDPTASNFPKWFLNRQKDLETGEDVHLITSDITLSVRNDIERARSTNSWRGYRHMFGLKVRGQRTRCTGRKGGAVGVAKGGKVLPKGGAGAPAATGTTETAPTTETTGTTAATAPTDEKKEAPKEVKKE
jgi:small subunit ribosomal protein S13